jgi:hypothetical protein
LPSFEGLTQVNTCFGPHCHKNSATAKRRREPNAISGTSN